MTLRKMYLVPAEDLFRGRPQSHPVNSHSKAGANRVTKRRKTVGKQHPYVKWTALRATLWEAAFKKSDLIHKFSKFLHKVLPEEVTQHPSTPQQHQHPLETVIIVETPLVGNAVSKRRLISDSSEDIETSSPASENARNLYEVSIAYLNEMRFLDEQYGIRRVGTSLMVGDSVVNIDETGDLSIN